MQKDKPCFVLLYTPNDDHFVTSVINGIMQNNIPPIKEEHVRGFSSMAEVKTDA